MNAKFRDDFQGLLSFKFFTQDSLHDIDGKLNRNLFSIEQVQAQMQRY